MKFDSIIVTLLLFVIIGLVIKNRDTIDKFHSTIGYVNYSITDSDDKVLELEDDTTIYEHFSSKILIIPEIASFIKESYKISNLDFAIWEPPKISI